jgi:hypothetical protein
VDADDAPIDPREVPHRLQRVLELRVAVDLSVLSDLQHEAVYRGSAHCRRTRRLPLAPIPDDLLGNEMVRLRRSFTFRQEATASPDRPPSSSRRAANRELEVDVRGRWTGTVIDTETLTAHDPGNARRPPASPRTVVQDGIGDRASAWVTDS